MTSSPQNAITEPRAVAQFLMMFLKRVRFPVELQAEHVWMQF